MGSWNTSITGNDTAQDLYIEYSAAFYKFDVEEALKKIDAYVRSEMFDESDEEEWCDYFYSLADFMWKKGILTDSVRDKAIEMIDSGFGLNLWAEEGEKTLNSRKKKLSEFREKLLSPQPAKKKIKPNVYTERIFEDGDIIAVQLKTEGKTYTKTEIRSISEEEFHALDGKYVLMQLINCYASWSSSIVPEVKDYWANFRLFDGIYDTVPEVIDFSELKEAKIFEDGMLTSAFSCESSLFYFKRRNYKVVCNRKDLIKDYRIDEICNIYWGINRSWKNPDSVMIASMGLNINCCEFTGSPEEIKNICMLANRYGRYNYSFSREENYARYMAEEKLIEERIKNTLGNGGKLFCIVLGRTVGIVTAEGNCIDNLYIEGQYQEKGLGTQLLEFAFSVAGDHAYIDVPLSNKRLMKVCKKLGLVKAEKTKHNIRMIKPIQA